MSMETCNTCFTVIDTDLDVDHEDECKEYHDKLREESVYEVETQDMGHK